MARRKRRYTVRTGDTASTIAKQLGVDPQTLLRANTGVSNLRPGMVLGIPRAGTMAQAYGGVQLGAMPVADPVPPGLEPYYPGGNYNPSDIMPATRPIPAYTQPAGHGTPTDYSQAYFGAPLTEPPLTSTSSQIVPTGWQQSSGLTDETMVRNGFIKQGNFWLKQTTPAVGDAGSGTPTLESYQNALYGGDQDAYRGMVQDVLGSRNFAIEDGIAYRRGPTGNITTTPISGATRRFMARPKSMAPRMARMRYGSGVETKESAQWKKRKHAYRDAQDAERDEASLAAIGEGAEPSADDFKAWYDQVTGYYGEDIWGEAKIGAGSGLTGRASIEYTDYAKGAFDRYSQLEQSDTKLGFYEWFQESQHIFGSAAWDNAMDKTVGGEYRTDKAKAAYQAYLGYEPDWEEAGFAGAASAPRYQQQSSGYGGGQSYMPSVRKSARPSYFGLINWRI